MGGSGEFGAGGVAFWRVDRSRWRTGYLRTVPGREGHGRDVCGRPRVGGAATRAGVNVGK